MLRPFSAPPGPGPSYTSHPQNIQKVRLRRTFSIFCGWLVYDGPGPGGAENGRNIIPEPILFFGKGSNILLTATPLSLDLMFKIGIVWEVSSMAGLGNRATKQIGHGLGPKARLVALSGLNFDQFWPLCGRDWSQFWGRSRD